MIYLIVGTNEYVIETEVNAIVKASSAPRETIDLAQLTLNGLADVMRGGSLFQSERLIVLKQLSEHKELWSRFGEWVSDVPDSTTIILLEPKPDKRTKTYKALLKIAKVIPAEPITDRQRIKAERWLVKLAKQQGITLTGEQANDMVSRALVIDEKARSTTVDQLQLTQALKALRNVQTIDQTAIATVLPPAREFSVFDVLELAVHGRVSELRQALVQLRRDDDAYKVAPLIWSQWSQLAMLALDGGETDLGIHPFVAKKLRPLASQLSRTELRLFTLTASRLDIQMKTMTVEPWSVIEYFLVSVALRDPGAA